MDRRESIVEAAKALLDEQGSSLISVRAVAARAGIGASTLRHYFPTQEPEDEGAVGVLLAAADVVLA